MNATALQFDSELTRSTAMPASRVLRAYLTEAKYESVRMLRTPAFAIPFLGLPVMLFLLIGVVLFGDAIRNDPNASKFVFAAFAVLGVMGPGMFGFGMALAIEREQGLLKLKRAFPMPPPAYLVAKMLMAMLFGVIVMITMIAAALTAGNLPLTPGQSLKVTVICVLGTLPFSAIGMLIGSLASGRSSIAYVNVIYQVMMHLSGLFYPLPKFLQTIAPVWPTHHLQQLVLSATGAPSRGSATIHVAVLAAMTLLFTLFAVRRLARVG
jgi:ABC-2 type transport system permease protein